jgi:hypothetical protein
MMVSMTRSDRLGDTVLIPVDGLVQVFLHEVDPTDLLPGSGRLGRLHVGRTGGVHFRIDEGAAINPRAQAALVFLAQCHMTLTGSVVFTGIPGDGVYQLIQHLDKEGTS